MLPPEAGDPEGCRGVACGPSGSLHPVPRAAAGACRDRPECGGPGWSGSSAAGWPPLPHLHPTLGVAGRGARAEGPALGRAPRAQRRGRAGTGPPRVRMRVQNSEFLLLGPGRAGSRAGWGDGGCWAGGRACPPASPPPPPTRTSGRRASRVGREGGRWAVSHRARPPGPLAQRGAALPPGPPPIRGRREGGRAGGRGSRPGRGPGTALPPPPRPQFHCAPSESATQPRAPAARFHFPPRLASARAVQTPVLPDLDGGARGFRPDGLGGRRGAGVGGQGGPSAAASTPARA